MQKCLALFMAFYLTIFPVTVLATEIPSPPKDENKAVLPLVIKSIQNPKDGNGGTLHANFSNGILMLDYDPEFDGEATLLFTLETEGGMKLPGEDKFMFLRDLSADELLVSTQNDQRIGGEEPVSLKIQVDPHVKGLTVKAEAEDAIFESQRVPVLWHRVKNGPPVRVLSIWPGHDITIGVGQAVEIKTIFDSDYTDMRVNLQVPGYSNSVITSGMTLEGIEPGQQLVMILNGNGTPIDAINVTVQQTLVEYEDPPIPAELPKYRVLAPTLDVFPDAAESAERMGTLRLFQIVGVQKIENDWTLLENGGWVLSKYLLKL